jgi:hypothetical protein
MDAEEFGAAVVTLRRALTLDGANKEAWAALERVAFVLDGRIYDVGDDGRLDLAGRKLGREGVTKLARWLATNAGAAMNSLTLDMNGIFGELYPNGNIKNVDTFAGDCDDFFAALKTSNIVTLSLQKTGIGPITLRKLATSLPAAVAQLILDENPLTGGTRSSHFDKDITGVVNLCDTLKTSSVTELSLANCRLGPGSLGKLAEYVRDATAAVLTKIDIRGAYIGEEVFAGLKGVAPEGCEVFWSEGDEGRVH